MKTAATLLALALLACAGPQRPLIDLEPESLYIEVDADAPISVTCTAGLPCGGSAYGEASVLVEGAGYLRVGDVLIPGTATASASASVASSDDGPVATASARMCFSTDSKIVQIIPGFSGDVCLETAATPDVE
jgi:hypothetical protein